MEEVGAIARHLYVKYRRAQAQTVLDSHAASVKEKEKATLDLLAFELRGPSLVHETTDLLVRSAASVLVESVAGGVGTFLLPGVGTLVFEVIGGLLCWI